MLINHAQLFCNHMDCVTHQAPLSIGFPRQEYWSGLPFLSPGDLSNSGLELEPLALAGRFFTVWAPWAQYTPTRVVKTQQQLSDNTNAGKGEEQQKLSFIVYWDTQQYSHFGL